MSQYGLLQVRERWACMCVDMCAGAHIHECIHACVLIMIHVCTSTYICVHICVYACVYIGRFMCLLILFTFICLFSTYVHSHRISTALPLLKAERKVVEHELSKVIPPLYSTSYLNSPTSNGETCVPMATPSAGTYPPSGRISIHPYFLSDSVVDVMVTRAFLIIHMIELRIGRDQLHQVCEQGSQHLYSLTFFKCWIIERFRCASCISFVAVSCDISCA